MGIIKRMCLSLLIRMYDSSLEIDYKKIDKKKLEDWCYRSFDDEGWKSYFGYADLKILKALSFGKSRDEYFILVGQRLQLLYLADEFRKVYELKKSEVEKNSVIKK